MSSEFAQASLVLMRVSEDHSTGPRRKWDWNRPGLQHRVFQNLIDFSPAGLVDGFFFKGVNI